MVDKLNKVKAVLSEVYGSFSKNKEWKPKPYSDTKGRYLWTDAFGVCNFITLYYETGDILYLDHADSLINDVHNTLGRERNGVSRLGSATDDEPTLGGLRIGKVQPEGFPDGDGQYFHYLTKWMFALNQMTQARKNSKYNHWAVQMAKSVHPHFIHHTFKGDKHMYWKISIDMSRPQVTSEGNLDPYDGYVTYRLLCQTAGDSKILQNEIADLRHMVEKKYSLYHSEDALDLGEALWISHWFPEEEWAKLLCTRSLEGIDRLFKYREFDHPRAHRLAFREFGTTIGVQCNPRASSDWVARAKDLTEFWSDYLYTRDRDITPVMYCSSLIPGVWKKDYEKRIMSDE